MSTQAANGGAGQRYEPLVGDGGASSQSDPKVNPKCVGMWFGGICGICSCCSCCFILFLVSAIVPGLLSASLSCFGNSACIEKATVNLPAGAHNLPLGYFSTSQQKPELRDETRISGWKDVKEGQKQMPKQTWDGEWWRGNELGFIVNNPAFWQASGIEPQTILLGAKMRQHAAVRPFLMKLFAADAAPDLREQMKLFLDERKEAGELKVPEDLIRFTHQLLYKTSFGSKPDWETTGKFYQVQQSVLKLGTVSQILPAFMWGLLGVDAAQESILPFYQDYVHKVEDKFGEQLTSLESECAPSPNCSIQLASGMWDAFYAAGGLSTPGVMHSGLAMMFSTDASNPTHKLFLVPPGKEREFSYEVMRFIPPVYGFPYWSTRPTCTGLTIEETLQLNKTHGDTKACPPEPVASQNQWQGGKRVVLRMEAAAYDKEAWGDDAQTFVIRNLAEYQEKFLGFADFAEDANVSDGANDRSCPGKQLSVNITTAFFEVFDPDSWTVDNSEIMIEPLGSLVQVASFVLKPRAP